MNSNIRKKVPRGRNVRYNTYNSNDNKNNFRGQDNYSGERKKFLCDITLYNIARFFMGNEIQIQTNMDRIEGVLRSFDSSSVWLSKVVVYDIVVNDNVSIVKELTEGKDVLWRDIVMMKALGTNGKADNVLVDQEISQRRQIIKPLQQEDKDFVPYFDDDEAQLDDGKDDDDLGISMKGDQGCWYNPEDMLKVNEERFNVKSTFNDSMEEYTTQIDKSDPLLQEKYERAEKWAREMENDTSLRRVCQLEDEDEELDEETRFSAVGPSVVPSTSKQEMTIAQQAPPMKLNPNAPEFRPRQKLEEHIDEMVMPNMILMSDSMQQQQQQIMHRYAMQLSMSAQQGAQQAVAQAPSYQGQRIIGGAPQWATVPMHHAGSPGQYVLQPYMQHAQIMPPVFQTRQMGQSEPPGPASISGVGMGGGNAGSVFYTMGGQFYLQPGPGDHMPGQGGLTDGVPHMYATTIDGHHMPTLATQLSSQSAQSQQRTPHIMPHSIPVIQQQQQIPVGHVTSLQQAQSAPPQLSQQHINTFYTQSPHQMMPPNINTGPGHPNFPQLIFNSQAQLPPGTSIQSYISNGRP